MAFTPETKNTSSFTSESFGLTAPTLAGAGLYYGFGTFTYSGGQQTAPGHLPIFSSESKNTSAFTSETKN